MNTASYRLKEVRIVGGFLDGINYRFSDKLNCIIGARGTGKTTFLEFIRYALNAMPKDTAAQKRIKSMRLSPRLDNILLKDWCKSL